MKAEGVLNYLQSSLRGLGLSFYLPGGDDFANKMNIGDIIKGRVLRHFEGSRYLVEFGGNERVVDSAIPLRTSEMLYGRVVGLGDKVELQRITQARIDAREPSTGTSVQQGIDDRLFAGKYEQLLNQVFGKYQGKLTAEAQNALLQQVRAATDPSVMVMAGLVLGKMGLPQNADLLRALYDAITANNRREQIFPMNRHAISAEAVAGNSTKEIKRSYNMLASGLEELLAEFPEQQFLQKKMGVSGKAANYSDDQMAGGSSDNPEDENYDIARWLLNAQVEGSVSHRVGTIPIWLGNKLLEIDVAMFDQKKHVESPRGLRHRQIVFSLNLEKLGHIEIQANIAGDHVRINFRSDREQSTDWLADGIDELRTRIADTDMKVDELRYETQIGTTSEGVARTVVEHIVSQDSLSRLM